MAKRTKTTRQKLLEHFERDCRSASKKQASKRKLREALAGDDSLQAEVRACLIADLQRVYTHPRNPYQGFAASRKRYRQLGHYPEILVEDFFGNHQEFLRAADLHDKRTTTKVRNRAALLHTHQQIADYASKHVLKWTGRHQKARGKRGHLEAIFASDFHSVTVDPFALEVFIATLKMVQPDIVVLGGDVFDFPQVSRHRKMPGHFNLNVQQEINWGRDRIMRRVRETCPDAEIIFVIGNHEYRLVTYIADSAPEMACLDDIDFNRLFKLDELEVNLVCRSSFLAPYERQRKGDVAENWHIIGGCWVVTHGTSIAKWAVEAEMARFRMSGTSGHTHRPQWYTDNSLGTGPLSWMSAPMMAGFAIGRDYVPTPSAWNMGFVHASINVDQGVVHQAPVLVSEKWATFAGQSWRPTEKALARRREQWEVGGLAA